MTKFGSCVLRWCWFLWSLVGVWFVLISSPVWTAYRCLAFFGWLAFGAWLWFVGRQGAEVVERDARVPR